MSDTSPEKEIEPLPEPPEDVVCEWYKLVKDFHEGFGLPAPTDLRHLDKEERIFRARLMVEEAIEFAAETDFVMQVDAMLDMLYFAVGTLVTMGVDPNGLFDIVHWANMRKLWPDGKPRYNEKGKVIKPPDYQSSDGELYNALVKQWKERKERGEKDEIPF